MKKYGALILGLALSWQSVEAKTILISDIDDTIKNSHILDTSEKLRSPFYLWNEVRGMSQVYALLQNTFKSSSGEISIPIYYVTNAPDLLDIMPTSHSLFLEKNNFPTGNLQLRDSLFEKEHKVKTIRNIIAKEQPTRLIMVGDNGEHDIPIYNQIREEFPDIEYSMHIRMAYYTQSKEEGGVALMDQQEGFASALDLALSWLNKGFISSDSLKPFIKEFSLGLSKEDKKAEIGNLAFPEWMDCRDVTFSADLLLNVPADSIEITSNTLSDVIERCSKPGSEN